MDFEQWAYLLVRNEEFHQVPSVLFQRFMEKEDSRTFSDLGAEYIRLAVLYVPYEENRPNQIKGVDFRRCRLTRDGSLDPKFKEKRRMLTEELASVQPRQHAGSTVVDASKKFKERRFHNEFSWTPTVSMVQKLSSLIQQRSKGLLSSRDVMYQILHLTATA